MKMNSLPTAWLRPHDWSRWREVDPNLPADCVRWLNGAEAKFNERQGHRLERVVIERDEVLEWSRIQGIGVDFEERNSFAATKLTVPNYRWVRSWLVTSTIAAGASAA